MNEPRQFTCAACGADLTFDPSAARLKCAACGTEQDIPAAAAGTVTEVPLAEGLSVSGPAGWGTERSTVHCEKCGAATSFQPGQVSGRCAFCGAATVVPVSSREGLVRPAALLAFGVGRDKAAEDFRKWLSGLWLAPNALRSESSLTALQGVYVPFFTFNAMAYATWKAESKSGQHQKGWFGWKHWEGQLDHRFDDVPIPASKGLDPKLAREVEPFPTADLIPYEPECLAGFLAEENAIGLAEAWENAQARMKDEMKSLCWTNVPGEKKRRFVVETRFTKPSFKNALLPIWISAYQYRGKPYRFLVNGVSGRTSGTWPLSWVKVSLIVLVFAVLLLLVNS